ncbi:MAG TPA: polyprenyl synthetase family protein [Propionicimonas sp.]|uniref:polyprenyl synthetase family protein n=1 Tax=Propionicimonas sp. TaxID=1955623 RepID=UPI002F4085A1
MVNLDAADPLSAELRAAVGAELAGFLDSRGRQLSELGHEVAELVELAVAFTAGGKRLRPAFCCWGYLAASGGSEVPAHVVRAAASLDLLHVSALVHDDVMDGSDTRRGVPAAHVQLAARHASDLRGDPDAFGRAGAILLGDLLLMWSVELFTECGAPADALAKAQPLLAAVRAEVTGGQFLDITAQTRQPLDARRDPASVLAQVRRVVEYKTARYTVVRPLQIGAALGGAGPELLAALGTYGSPLGRAFQYRDDVLGVFGDEAVTGKPAGDDLREGKLTVLIAKAMSAAPQGDAERLDALLGSSLSAQDVATARSIIAGSGALAATEQEIEDATAEALRALGEAGIGSPAVDGLRRLAGLASQRDA